MWQRAFQIDADRTGNLPPLPGIFPNTAAPIAHIAQGQRVLSMYRWGMPSPAFALGEQAGRFRCHQRAHHRRRWLGPEHLCLVPLAAFSEFNIEQTRPWIGDFWRTGAMPGAVPGRTAASIATQVLRLPQGAPVTRRAFFLSRTQPCLVCPRAKSEPKAPPATAKTQASAKITGGMGVIWLGHRVARSPSMMAPQHAPPSIDVAKRRWVKFVFIIDM